MHPDQSDLRHVVAVRESWTELVEGCDHLRLLASAVAAGIFPEDDDEDWEATYAKEWKMAFIRGSAKKTGGEYECEKMERELQEAVDARILEEDDADKLHMMEHPEAHLEIVRFWFKIAWMRKNWTFQRFFSRALDRDRFIVHFGGLPSDEEKVRLRSHLDSLATIPHLIVPSNPGYVLTDAEYVWLVNARLGRRQPSTLELGPYCMCAAGTAIGNGHHCRVCRVGGGKTRVHNNVRDVFQKCGSNAGVVSKTETPLILPGTDERPGDVVFDGIGRGGGDLVTDVTVVDPLASFDAIGQGEVRTRTLTVGAAAAGAERRKRVKRGGPRGDKMEDRVRRVGKEFFPVGFETSGASTSQCSKLLKKLSEIAHERRGHHKAYFILRWRATLAMTLAKKGCEVALQRAYKVRHEQRGGNRGVAEADEDSGSLLNVDADAFIHGGYD